MTKQNIAVQCLALVALSALLVLSTLVFGLSTSRADTHVSDEANLASDIIWIDVRSQLEYQLDHIDGDRRVSHSEIVQYALKNFPDKQTSINLYCRSGPRAERALQALKQAGYTQVSNVGGIDNARQLRRRDRSELSE